MVYGGITTFSSEGMVTAFKTFAFSGRLGVGRHERFHNQCFDIPCIISDHAFIWP